jgi:triacylglycerol lipase
LLCGLLLPLPAENRYPIVLIHGFIGWGPEEMGGYRYWGGSFNLEQELREEGYTVYTVSVGPVSSNWDRAVEVFYQLKGGQVDYGEAHAREFGIIRKPPGKVYPGLYPEWDAEHPVHLIGHSMGGQTARMLLYLLSQVFYADSAGTVPEESLLLGQAQEGWIASVTSIATPHNGTTLTNIVTRSVPFLQYFIGLAAVVGNRFYDFDLQQWGFSRQPEESWVSYYRRMREHPAWNTTNISAWDLSLEGARQLNTLLPADPDVYYFAFVLSATHLDSATGRHVPDDGMSLILQAKARLIGSQTAYWADGTPTDSTWFENDGVVNTVSQYGPTTGLNGPDPIAEFRPNEPLIPGQWYTFGPLKMDHWRVVGHGVSDREEWEPIYRLYADHCRRLWNLP